jgi:hypothetical protein
MLCKTKIEIKKVAIMGDAEAKRYSLHYRGAYNTAYLLAKSGYVIVNGGGPGVMLAASLGAKAAGGKVEIVTISDKNKPDNFEGSHKRNLEAAHKIYYENTYNQRLAKLVSMSDAFVFFKGGTGTISEIGLCWQMAKFEYGKHSPLIFYGSFWKKILNKMKDLLPLTKDETTVYAVAKNAKDVVSILTKVQVGNYS